MPATAQPHYTSEHSTEFPDVYDPDDCVPRNSPLMTPLRPNLRPSPTPPPEIPQSQVSANFFNQDDPHSSNRTKIRTGSGEAVLLTYLSNGRQPDIIHSLSRYPLAEDSEYLPAKRADRTSITHDTRHGRPHLPGDITDFGGALSPVTSNESHGRGPLSAASPTSPSSVLGGSLQHLAVAGLQVAGVKNPSKQAHQSALDIAAGTRQLSISDDKPQSVLGSLNDLSRTRRASSPGNTSSISGELPPIHHADSPRTEFKVHCLPSIRSQLGNLNRLPPDTPTSPERDLPSAQSIHYSRSPPADLPPLAFARSPTSPPISPINGVQQSWPSPHNLSSATSPFSHSNAGSHRRSVLDYSSSSNTAETPSTDQNPLTPRTLASVPDRMSIEGITNPPYVCTVPGCKAPPFQTQYLLNSHANVHSSARPHYCPVLGCPRSEAGKGFKRKNEMIRHGLVHDSPGYVCPFCPDKEHRYPRPDNLQRHVRVHHIDKEKDDPVLREVLAQRADGPSRGRRRRGLGG